MPLSVLHGPHNISDQAVALSAAERKQHVASDAVLIGSNDVRAQKRFSGSGAGPFLNRLQFAMRAPLRYDVLHLYFAGSFLELGERWSSLYLKEARLAQRLGRPVFFTLQGCDVRLAGQNYAAAEARACREGYCDKFEFCVTSRDADRLRRIAAMRDVATGFFILNPDLRRSVPEAEFLPYAIDIGAIDAAVPDIMQPPPDGSIRIVHAPTDRAMKGTPMIEAAISELAKTWPIEFILLQNMPKAELWRRVTQADIVIDQCLLGWYGAFATEAMALGKPVMAFIRDADRDVVPPAMMDELPVLDLHPDRLVADIEAALERRLEWAEIGQQGAGFVRRWHDAEVIASAMIRKYLFPDRKLDVAAFVPNRAAIQPLRTA